MLILSCEEPPTTGFKSRRRQSPLLREVFLRVLRFFPLLQNQQFQIAVR